MNSASVKQQEAAAVRQQNKNVLIGVGGTFLAAALIWGMDQCARQANIGCEQRAASASSRALGSTQAASQPCGLMEGLGLRP
jgi:hypothetical protein